MNIDTDYIVKKIQVTALQRFKNQNTLLKEFGEDALRTYKEIDNKKTATEIKEKLKIEKTTFKEILEFMENENMIELESLESGNVEEELAESTEDKIDEETQVEERKVDEIVKEDSVTHDPEISEGKEIKEDDVEELGSEEDKFESIINEKIGPENITEEDTINENIEARNEKEKLKDDEDNSGEIQPIDIGEEGSTDEIEPEEEEKKIEIEETTDEIGEEIEPIDIEEDGEHPEEVIPEEEEKKIEIEETTDEIGEEIEPEVEEGESIEITESNDEGDEQIEEVDGEGPEEVIDAEEDDEIEPFEDGDTISIDEDEENDGEEPVEKIIRDKYGAIGIAVYTLIDGNKSAEEIMAETGLTEVKLIEILDFMEEKNIIKLEYPDKKKETVAIETDKDTIDMMEGDTTFTPLTDTTTISHTISKGMQTIDIPKKLPLDIVRSVQLKAKIMFEFSDKGSRVFEAIDGKKDIIEIVLKTKNTLVFVTKIFNFLSEKNAIILQPLERDKIKEKYGVEAYRIYKRFGREGVLLYELVGKDLDIKQMMQKITKDKNQFVDIFVFVHKVLGVPIPVEKDIILKKLE